MADVGKKTGKKTQAGRDVYETAEGEMVSEKSTTIKYKGKWINVPTIHAGKQYSENKLVEMLDEGLIEPTSTHSELKEAIEAAQSRSNSLEFNKGGTPMQEQMELFEDGGLKDEGGMVDEESGNEVPVGGTRKGVRDDIPANISEGEFIFPEDVTRYIGLDKLMQLRQDAKMGLKRMEAMGQMGNSDEASIPDDLPFGMADLIIVGGAPEDDEELNMAEGGLTTTSTGSSRTVAQPIVQEPTTPVTTQPTVTRRLTPEPVATSSIPIDFKQLMGDAAIEYKEYRNAAGESMMIPIVGGVPQFPVPEGYTLYTGTDAVENSNTTAGAIVRAANTATAEVRAASMGGDNDTPPPMPTAEAINWSGLSTKELIERSAELTGTTSTIAKGAMAFFGPFGAIGYAMMRHQEKKVAAEIASRLAKGGLTAAQRKSLTETQEKLAPAKVTTLFGKVIEFLGGALGLTDDDVEAAKKSAGVSEDAANKAPDAATNTAEVATTINQEIVNANQAALEEAAFSAITTQQPTDPLEPFGSAGPDIPSMPIEDVIASEAVAPYDYTDPRNLGGAEGYGQTGIAPQQPVVAEPSRIDQIYSASIERIKNTENNNVARIKDPRLKEESTGYNRPLPDGKDNFFNQDIDMGAAGYGPQPVQQQTASAFGLPREDFSVSVPETKFTAPTTPVYEPLQDYQAPSQKNIFSEKNAGTFFNRAGTKAKSLLTGTPVSALQAENLGYSTEQPIRETSVNRPPAVGSGGIFNPAKSPDDIRYTFPPSTTPKTTSALQIPEQVTQRIAEQQAQQIAQQQAQAGPDVPGGVLPANVQQQTNQLFSGSTYDQVPTQLSRQGFNFGAEDTAMSMPVGRPDLLAEDTAMSMPVTPTFNLGSVEGQLSTSPDLANKRTFNEEFAAQRKAGAKEFSYDRDGDGKTERYTTQTVEEAAPAGTNTFIQSAKNILTPFDNKEYVGGKLVTTKKDRDTSSSTSKSKARAASAKVKDQVATSSGKKVTVETKPSNKKTEGAVSSGGQYAGDGFEWVAKKNADGTPALNKNGGKQLTRTYTGVNKNATGSNDTSSASSSGSDKSIVCTEMYRQTQLADWQQAMKIWHVYQEKHLTMYHQVGYHWLFQPYVKGMKNSSILTKLGSKLAKHRTQHLRHVLTKGKAKDDVLGNIWCKFIHPLVYVAGVIKEKIGK